jgi:hypothetical protein
MYKNIVIQLKINLRNHDMEEWKEVEAKVIENMFNKIKAEKLC